MPSLIIATINSKKFLRLRSQILQTDLSRFKMSWKKSKRFKSNKSLRLLRKNKLKNKKLTNRQNLYKHKFSSRMISKTRLKNKKNKKQSKKHKTMQNKINSQNTKRNSKKSKVNKSNHISTKKWTKWPTKNKPLNHQNKLFKSPLPGLATLIRAVSRRVKSIMVRSSIM